MKCVFPFFFISSIRLTRHLGPTDTTASAKRKRRPQIHRPMANATTRHQGRGRTIAVQRSQRTSDARCAQCCSDVLDIRRLPRLGRKSLRLERLNVIAASFLPSLHLLPSTLSSSYPDGAAPSCLPCKSELCVDVSHLASVLSISTRPDFSKVLYYPTNAPLKYQPLAPVSRLNQAFERKTKKE